MSVSRREALIAGAGALPVAGLLAVTAKAQSSSQTGQPGGTVQPGTTGGTLQPGTAGAAPAGAGAARGEDPLLAACLLTGGRRQIEVCRVAMDRLKNEDVKAFAKAEIAEHEKNKADLQAKFGFTPPAPVAPAAGGAVRGAAGAAVVPGASGPGAVVPGATGTGTGTVPLAGGAPPAAGAPLGAMPPVVAVGRVVFPPELSQLLMVENEVVDQCVKNFQQVLQRKEQKGAVKVDKAFVGDQYVHHQGLKDRVEVFIRHASAEMQPLLRQNLEIINQHIATCESLMDKLDQQDMQGGGNRGTGDTTGGGTTGGTTGGGTTGGTTGGGTTGGGSY